MEYAFWSYMNSDFESATISHLHIEVLAIPFRFIQSRSLGFVKLKWVTRLVRGGGVNFFYWFFVLHAQVNSNRITSLLNNWKRVYITSLCHTDGHFYGDWAEDNRREDMLRPSFVSCSHSSHKILWPIARSKSNDDFKISFDVDRIVIEFMPYLFLYGLATRSY